MATALVLGAAGCSAKVAGNKQERDAGQAGAKSGPTIYAGLPLTGPGGQPNVQSKEALNAMLLALKQAGNKAGPNEVRFKWLDNSTRQAEGWAAGPTILNAQKVAKDRSAVAYLGDLNSGASAASIPILNRAGIAQIGYSNTAVGLTKDDEGADEGDPERYYPTAKRNYVRLVPTDAVQGAVLATLMTKSACKEVAILHDKETYGAGLAAILENELKERGAKLVTSEGVDQTAQDYKDLATRLGEESTDCVVYAGITANKAAPLFRDLSAGLSSAKFFGGDGLADTAFTNSQNGGVTEEVGARFRITAPTLPPDRYPPAGKKFFADYEKEYGKAAQEPYSIYAYEAMRLALEAVAEAGPQGTDSQAVIDDLFETSSRQSVLGTYGFDEDGDTSLADYAVYRIEDKKLAFDQTLKPDAR